MSLISIYVLVAMLISSLLGFLAAWSWKQSSLNSIKEDYSQNQKEIEKLQAQLTNLQDHSLTLEKEKQNLVYENERLTRKLDLLLKEGKNLEVQKSSIDQDGFVDTSNLDKKINDLNAQVDKLNAEIDIVKKESLEWQVQYTEVLKDKEELSLQLLAHRNTSK